ncbi:YggS family pyridoxal phosphate-dependent enzyme [bacterium]|nr:YggS family pyridoxal phosphate-dependent enzyme [bacterium]
MRVILRIGIVTGLKKALRADLGHSLPLETTLADSIKERYFEVDRRISLACRDAGRNRDDVKLIVVTKGHSSLEIMEVINAGAMILGENYPEETLIKIEEIESLAHPTWHMIGHLQSRKIKLMYPSFKCIQSIDSLELAQKINKFFEEKDSTVDALIEINVAGEESKFGFDASSPERRESLITTIESISHLPHINLVGLMTMPPYAVEPTQNEACYNLCQDFCTQISKNLGLNKFKQLSMGTSADFETAIKCGATFIRVGEAIMGKRYYPNKT